MNTKEHNQKSRTVGKIALCALMAKLSKKKPMPIANVMRPIQKESGSRFGEDVIRITGSEEFCTAVLSRVSDLIEVERDDATRLDCSWSVIEDGGDRFRKGGGGHVIYLRMAVRSSDSNDSPMSVAHRETRIHF